MTEFGKKGGSGKTAGMKAATYRVVFPDGTETKKRTFETHADEAWAMVYEHEGKWFCSCVRAEVPAWAAGSGQQPVKARKVS